MKIIIPLSSMTSKEAKWNRSKECQKAFDTIKNLVSMQTLLSCANLNKPFEIHTYASKLLLRPLINQKGKPILLYSKMLSPT